MIALYVGNNAGAARPGHVMEISREKSRQLLSRILTDATAMRVDGSDSFLISYREFIDYFRQAQSITRHHVIIGASFVYSWMPTILDFRSQEFDRAAEILESARRTGDVDGEQLKLLACLVNNSVVGASKLLHVVAPHEFGIWDSRVASYLEMPVGTGVDGAITQCRRYWALLRKLASTTEAADLAAEVTHRLGYDITPVRALELAMFSTVRSRASKRG